MLQNSHCVTVFMSGLKLNSKKQKPTVHPPVNTSNVFEDEENEANDLANTANTKKQLEAIEGLNLDLRSHTSLAEETSARMAKEALEADPSGTISP